MNKLIILRGLPGAGKSTLVSKLEIDNNIKAVICSADDFFYFGKDKIKENYKYDINLARKAHFSCKEKCIKALKNNESLIIIDNTNIKYKEYKDYITLGSAYNYEIEIHAIVGMKPEDSFNLNEHNVPLNVCEKKCLSYKEHSLNDGIKEIKHDFLLIRKGEYGNGKFT